MWQVRFVCFHAMQWNAGLPARPYVGHRSDCLLALCCWGCVWVCGSMFVVRCWSWVHVAVACCCAAVYPRHVAACTTPACCMCTCLCFTSGSAYQEGTQPRCTYSNAVSKQPFGLLYVVVVTQTQVVQTRDRGALWRRLGYGWLMQCGGVHQLLYTAERPGLAVGCLAVGGAFSFCVPANSFGWRRL